MYAFKRKSEIKKLSVLHCMGQIMIGPNIVFVLLWFVFFPVDPLLLNISLRLLPVEVHVKGKPKVPSHDNLRSVEIPQPKPILLINTNLQEESVGGGSRHYWHPKVQNDRHFAWGLGLRISRFFELNWGGKLVYVKNIYGFFHSIVNNTSTISNSTMSFEGEGSWWQV